MSVPASGGIVVTSSSFGIGQTRESVRNPQNLREQTRFMQTGPLKKIKQASPQTIAQWHADIAANPATLQRAIAKLNSDLKNIDSKPFGKPSSKWKHGVTALANAVLSVPDAGNAKRNRNSVLSLSKRRQLPDAGSPLAKVGNSFKTAATKVKRLTGKETTPAAPASALQTARMETTTAFRHAIACGQLAMNAQQLEMEAAALLADLQMALPRNIEARLQAMPHSGNVTRLEQEVHDLKAEAARTKTAFDRCEKAHSEISKLVAEARAACNQAPAGETTNQAAANRNTLEQREATMARLETGLDTARQAYQAADAALKAAEQQCKEAQAWTAIQQAGTEGIDAAIAEVTETIRVASEQAAKLNKERDYSITAFTAAEMREMNTLIEQLPGFDTGNTDAAPLRKELRQLVKRLDQRPTDLSKPRIPSPVVLGIAIGALDQVIAPRQQGETEAGAAARRQSEATQILQHFTRNLPSTSSDAHQRWHAAINSLPGGLRVMEQFGFSPSDEEATVVFARHIAGQNPELAGIANRVALAGQVDVLDPAGRKLYDAALAELTEGRNPNDLKRQLVAENLARRVLARAENSLQADVPGADRNALLAAKRAAEAILRNGGNTGAAPTEDLKHYNALRKEQEAVRRTATYVGAIARNLQLSGDPRVDRALTERAAFAADHIRDNGHDFDLGESTRACFYAVRNGFVSAEDANIAFANGRFEKLTSTWVERADLAAAQEKLDRTAVLKKARPDATERPANPRVLTREGVEEVRRTREALREQYGDRLREGFSRLRVPNTLRNKTPFTPDALREASRISTLGYADPARPMQRLDKVVGRILKNLDKSVDSIPAHSLSADQAVMLAATLVTAEKVRADTKRRPGDVTLAPADAARIATIFNTRIRPLVIPLELQPDDGRINDGIAQLLNGDVPPKLAGADSLVELVNDLSRIVPTTLENGNDNASQRELMKDAGIAADMINTVAVSGIHTVVDLYKYLKPMIQQLELRGKVKSSAGGALGVSTRLVSFPLDLTAELTGLPRGSLGGSRVRHAVFEIGFSTTGFEIFIGSEKKVGAFASGGFGIREDVAKVIGFGAGVDKTLSIDSSTIPGVWLKFPRGDGDEVVRDRALAGLQTLLGIRDVDGNVSAVEISEAPAAADPEPPIIPGKIGKLLANNPNMSVSIVGDYQETNFKNELAASANLLSLKVGPGQAMPRVAALQAGASTAFSTKQFDLSDATGYMRLTRSNKRNAGIAFAQGVIGGVSESFATGNPPTTSAAFATALAQARQVHERGVDTKYRGISRDGEINAVDTRLDTENVNLANHIARIEANRRAWIQCGINELFKDPKDPTPMREKIRIAEAWLDDHIQAVRDVANDNARHVFSLSYSLKPPAGAVLDGLNAGAELQKRLLESGKGKDARDAYMQDIAQIDEVMLDQTSWREWKITASERTSEKRSHGWVLGGEYTRRNVGEGQRGFNSYPK